MPREKSGRLGLTGRVRHLFVELKRRKVFRATLVYVAVAWGVVEVAETTFPYVGLPQWTITLVIALAALGLPVVVVLAWALELTRSGLRAEGDGGAAGADDVAIPPGATERPGGPGPRADVGAERLVNLPSPTTPLFGRNSEVAHLRKLLTEEACRMVTLTGPGGIGKSRLAIRAAREAARSFPDGVFFVPLASVTDPALVASSVTRCVGVREEAGRSLLESLIDQLRSRRVLLVLDNFEQLVNAAPWVAELLEGASGVAALATSREPLRIRGEQEYPVMPLGVPDPEVVGSPEELLRHPAVACFVDRARGADPEFQLTHENAEAVAEVCVRLEGLPLGIELAAARVKMLPPRALRDRLGRRLDVLTGGARDLPARQRTLRDTIAWSHDLLDDDERKAFRRIAVFAGEFGLEAAGNVVYGGERSPKTKGAGSSEGVLDGLASLVNKSLLLREFSGDEARFRMLESIREYALERLAEGGEEERVRRRHADHFAAVAEQAAAELPAGGARWLLRLDAEHDNMRTALDWLEAQRKGESGLRMCVALWRFWELRGYLSEARERLDGFLELAGSSVERRLGMKGLYAAGVLAEAQGDYNAARRHFRGNLALCRELGDERGIANSLNNLGIIAVREEEYAEARELYEESLAIWRRVAHRPAVALSLRNLGNVQLNQRDHAEARASYRESLEIFRDLEDQRGVAWSLERLARLARDENERDEARRRYRESLETFREIEDRKGEATLLAALGDLALEEEEGEAASALYGKSLEIFHVLGDRRNIARLLENFAVLAVSDGRPERGLRLAGAASALRDAISAPLPPVERRLLESRLETGRRELAEAAETAVEAGRRMDLDEALAYAIEWDTA